MSTPKEYRSRLLEFHRCFQQHHTTTWADFDPVSAQLGAKLLKEELAEYNAAKVGDYTSRLDALGDMTYLVFGASARVGILPEPFTGNIPVQNPNIIVPAGDAINKLLLALESPKPCYTSHWSALNTAYWRMEVIARAMGVVLWDLFLEIHRSNMTKLWKDEEAQSVPNTLWAIRTGPNRWVVKNQLGKVIKSPSYSPVDLTPFVKAVTQLSERLRQQPSA